MDTDFFVTPPVSAFSLADTLECGQCFRWKRIDLPDNLPEMGAPAQVSYLLAAGSRCCAVTGYPDGRLLFSPPPISRIGQTGQPAEGYFSGTDQQFWREYFDLDRDYAAIQKQLSQDPVLEQACRNAPGIRILKQDGWEALCTFIISQNNNIQRIGGIVGRLCDTFGDPIAGGGGIRSFPGPERLAVLQREELAPLRVGFRDRYILDAARKTALPPVCPPESEGESAGRNFQPVSLETVKTAPLKEAKAMLMTILGVGTKVADCALLFGFGRLECVPQDVWIKRVMAKWYPQGLPEFALPYAGIAQQYLFHYARTAARELFREGASAVES